MLNVGASRQIRIAWGWHFGTAIQASSGGVTTSLLIFVGLDVVLAPGLIKKKTEMMAR